MTIKAGIVGFIEIANASADGDIWDALTLFDAEGCLPASISIAQRARSGFWARRFVSSSGGGTGVMPDSSVPRASCKSWLSASPEGRKALACGLKRAPGVLNLEACI